MKRILLIGNAPLPEENTLTRPAAGLRTHQFLKSLIDKRFLVELVSIMMPECYEGALICEEKDHGKRFKEFRVSKNDPQLLPYIQKIHDDFHPDAIVAVNTHPSYIASLIDSRTPLWSDLNGWIMAEAQAQAYKKESNDYLSHYHNM